MDFDRFYNFALRFLSYRPRSEQEIRNKLKVKRASEEIIEKIISKLIEKKFINDEEFARMFVENRLRFKPRSLRLIKIELKRKGISDEIIEELVVSRGSQVESDLESAKRLIERKMSRSRNTRLHLPSQSDGGQEFGMTPDKLGRYLASKGFNWDTIKKSIDEVLAKGV